MRRLRALLLAGLAASLLGCGSNGPAPRDARGDAVGDKAPAADAPTERPAADATAMDASDGANTEAAGGSDAGDAAAADVPSDDGSPEASADSADATDAADRPPEAASAGDGGDGRVCAQNQARCQGGVYALCMNDVWVTQRLCQGSSFCENDQCVDTCTPAVTRCGPNHAIETCGTDLRWHVTETCAYDCRPPAGVNPAECTCVAGDTSCTVNDDPSARICTSFQVWAKASTPCFVCKAGKCQGVCSVDSHQCSGKERQTCDADGQWKKTETCANACNDGVCGACPKGGHRCVQGMRDVCSADIAWTANGSCVTRLVGRTTISCAVKADGSFRCEGEDFAMSPHIGNVLAKVRLLAAGNLHECAVAPDNTVLCSGWNGYGQQNIPAGLAGGTITDLVAGAHHTCALRNDGQLTCWGDNTNGRASPPPLPAGVTYTQVATTYDDTCAVRSDGTLVGFGTEDGAQFSFPALPAGVRYVRCAPGYPFSCALRSDNVISCWGDNSKGQLAAPAAPAGVTFTDVCAGEYFGCALRSDGVVTCWGAILKTPAAPAGETFVGLNCGDMSASGVLSDGTSTWWNQGEQFPGNF